MTRFKKEIRKRGYKLELDYPTLPYEGIETVSVNSELARLSIYHVGYGWYHLHFQRDLVAAEEGISLEEFEEAFDILTGRG